MERELARQRGRSVQNHAAAGGPRVRQAAGARRRARRGRARGVQLTGHGPDRRARAARRRELVAAARDRLLVPRAVAAGTGAARNQERRHLPAGHAVDAGASRGATSCGRKARCSCRTCCRWRAARRSTSPTATPSTTTSSRSPRRHVRPGTLPARAVTRSPVRDVGAREGLLPPALGHERRHHGARSPVVHDAAGRRWRSCSTTCRQGKRTIAAWHERVGEAKISVDCAGRRRNDRRVRAPGGGVVTLRHATASAATRGPARWSPRSARSLSSWAPPCSR